MRRIKRVKVVSVALLISGLTTGLSAQPVAADNITPSLVISQLKVTSSNGQYVMLYNTTNSALNMSDYRLEYFNSYDLSKATTSRVITLSGSLPPHGYYLVNDNQMLLCYQMTINAVSLGFSTTAGLVQLLTLSQSSPGSSASPTVQDYVGWSKTAVSGAQTLPATSSATLLRQPVDAHNNPIIDTPGFGTWLSVQSDTTNACNLVSQAGSTIGIASPLLPASPPPAIILPTQTVEVGVASTNVGLMAPQLTELLPNPLGAGNDATDEFIEIYNSNPVAFDLSGYSLRAGVASLHSYVLPTPTILPAQGYAVFYAKSTGLSLSNTGGQVKLLDPSGNAISATGIYDTAKDGMAWANANGNWSWTNLPTPGTINVITQPAVVKVTAQTPAPALAATASTKSSTSPQAAASNSSPKTTTSSGGLTPIHNWTLALVAIAALLYGAYEYRADLGNRIHQLRQHYSHRRTDWSPFTWWRSNRTS